jgi:hypothetical protein
VKHQHGIRERKQFGAANNVIFHDVPMMVGQLITYLAVFLRGSLVIAGGTVNGTALGENPAGLIQRFEVDAVSAAASIPGGKLKSLTPRTVLLRRIFDRGFKHTDLQQAAGINGAAGTYAVNSRFELPFALPTMLRPFDTALALDFYRKLTLKITNGGRDTQYAGNDRNFDYSGLYYDIVDYRENNGAAKPAAVLYDDDRVIQITGANKRLPVKGELPQGEAYVDLLWIAETTNKALSDGIIQKVDLYTGTENFLSLEADEVKGEQLQSLTDAAQVSAMTGLYHTPIVRDGLLSGTQTGISAVLDVLNPAAGADQLTLATRRLAPVGQ